MMWRTSRTHSKVLSALTVVLFPRVSGDDVQCPTLYNCQPNLISWTGAPPFHIMFLNPNDHSQTVFDLGVTYKNNVSWDCPLDAGTPVQVKVIADDETAFSGPRTIRDDCPQSSSTQITSARTTTVETTSVQSQAPSTTSVKPDITVSQFLEAELFSNSASSSNRPLIASSQSVTTPSPTTSSEVSLSSLSSTPSSRAPNQQAQNQPATSASGNTTSEASNTNLSLTLGLALGLSSLLGFGFIAFILYRRLRHTGGSSTAGSLVDYFRQSPKRKHVEVWMDHNKEVFKDGHSEHESDTLSRRTSLISSSNAASHPSPMAPVFLPSLGYGEDNQAGEFSDAALAGRDGYAVRRTPSTVISTPSASPSSCALPSSKKRAPLWKNSIKGFVPRTVLTQWSTSEPTCSAPSASASSPRSHLGPYDLDRTHGHRTAPSIQEPTPYPSMLISADRVDSLVYGGESRVAVPITFGNWGNEVARETSYTGSFGTQ